MGNENFTKKEWLTPVLTEENIEEETMFSSGGLTVDGGVHSYVYI